MRRWLIALGVMIVLLLAGVWGVAAYLRSGRFERRVRAYVTAEIQQASGARVEMGGFHMAWRWRLPGLELELDHLVLHGREGAGQPPLAKVPRLRLGVRLVSLARREIRLGAIEVAEPRVRLYQLADGASNLPLPSEPWQRRNDEVRTLLEVGAASLTVEQGELDLQDRRIPLNLHAAGVELRLAAAGPRGRAAYAGELQVGQGTVEEGKLPAVPFALGVKFRLEASDLQLQQVRAEAAGMRMEGAGELRNFPQPAFQFRFHATGPVTAAARAVGMRDDPQAGAFEASGTGTWAPGSWNVAGTARGTGLRWPARGPGEWAGQAEFQAGPAGLYLSRLDMNGLGGRVEARGELRGWREWTLAGTFRGMPLEALADWRGLARAPAQARAALRGRQERARGSFRYQGQGWSVEASLEGGVAGAASLSGNSAGTVQVRALQLHAPAASVRASGTVSARAWDLRLDATVSDAAALRAEAVRDGIGLPQAFPDATAASATVHGRLSGNVAAPAFTGEVELSRARLRVRGQALALDSLELEGSVAPRGVHLNRAVAQRGRQRIEASGDLGLTDFRITPQSRLDLQGTGQRLPMSMVAALAGLEQPILGSLSGRVHLQGVWAQPDGSGAFTIAGGRWYSQNIQSITASFQLRNGLLTSQDFALALARTRVQGTLRLGFHDHSYRVDLSSPAVQLSDLAVLQSERLPLAGQLRFQLTGEGKWEAPQAQLVLTSTGLRGGGESLGDLGAKLQLRGGMIQFQAADILPNGNFNLTGTLQTDASYRVDAHLQLHDYDFDAWLRRFTRAEVSGHSHMSGTAQIAGPLARPGELVAHIALDPVELAVSGLTLRNQSPIQLDASRQTLRLTPARMVGQDTDFTLQGEAGLGQRLRDPMRLRGEIQGRVNLALLESLHPATHATGEVTVEARLGGTTAQPGFTGQVSIENASLAEQNLPIGFDSIHGQLRLSGRRVQIDQLTAHTGSGELDISGFGADTANGVSFDLGARGQNLRLRYQGISATGDLQLRLSGQPSGALLAGDAQLNRIGLDPQFDLAVLLAAFQAPSAPPDADSVLNRVHMDIHLVTGPQVEVATNAARLQLQADLRLRGTLAEPAVLGRASASQGRVLFAGNEFQVTKAQVQFANPFRIAPQLDIGLTTTVQPYDVTLNIAGPPDKLAITYRSDPPLASADVVALLATGQPTQATASLNAAGNSFAAPSEQILGQALDNVVAGRLQRLFGITQVHVNPNSGPLGTTGSGGTVTVQQQVSRNLKLTYTQNLASSSQDIIQIDWTITRALGITLNRDQFGLYGLKFTFRQRRR